MFNDFGRCKIHPTAAHFERLWFFCGSIALPPDDRIPRQALSDWRGLGRVELTSPAPVSRTTRLWAQISSSTATTKRSGRWATKRGRSSFSGRQQGVAARSGVAGSPSMFLHNCGASIQ